MVATLAQLDAVDAAHKAQQAKNAAAVAALVLVYWRAVEGRSIAATGAEFLAQSIAAIFAGRERSIGYAQTHYETVRRMQLPGERPPLIERPAPPPEEQLRKSLAFTGLGGAAVRLAKIPTGSHSSLQEVAPDSSVVEADPGALDAFYEREASRARSKKGIERQRAEAMNVSGKAASAAAFRHVQNGGRDFYDQAVTKDRLAVGYVRITGANPCYFCALLASRGPVYKDNSFAASDVRFEGEGDHKVHDSCGCTLRAIYSRDPREIPEKSRDFDKLYRSVAGGGAKATRLAFRQAYEGRAVA